MESPKLSDKISEVVRLRRLLKKWKNFANSSKAATAIPAMSLNCGSTPKSISFLKRSISSLSSYDDDDDDNKNHNSGNSNVVPKGYLAVCISEELERFVFSMHYLSHLAFEFLLREAKEVFRFQQTGVLRIPCDVIERNKKAVNNGGLVAKEQCRLSADETFRGFLLEGGEMDYGHLHHSSHHPWSPLCR